MWRQKNLEPTRASRMKNLRLACRVALVTAARTMLQFIWNSAVAGSLVGLSRMNDLYAKFQYADTVSGCPSIL